VNLLRFTPGHVNLSDHDAGCGRWIEWEGSDKLSNSTASGYNRRLFNAHGDHKFFLVDYKLGYNCKRQGEHSNNVFYHSISDIEFQSSSEEIFDLNFRLDPAIHNLDSILNGQFIELLLVQRHSLVEPLYSLEHLLWRYLVGRDIDMGASVFVLPSPLLIDLRQVVNVLLQLVKLDFNIPKEITETLLSLNHHSIVFLGIYLYSIIQPLFYLFYLLCFQQILINLSC